MRQRLVGHVGFVEQSRVVLVAGINLGTVDASKGDPVQLNAGLSCDIGLNADIHRMVGFGKGGGFHLHQSPAECSLPVGWQHDIGQRMGIVSFEGHLKR